MKLILTLATIAALAAASVHAGGPVLIEDTETRAEPRDRNAVLPLIIGALIVGGLLASSGNCFTEEPTPEPEQPGVGC